MTNEHKNGEGRMLAARITNPYPSVGGTASTTVPVWQQRLNHHTRGDQNLRPRRSAAACHSHEQPRPHPRATERPVDEHKADSSVAKVATGIRDEPAAVSTNTANPNHAEKESTEQPLNQSQRAEARRSAHEPQEKLKK